MSVCVDCGLQVIAGQLSLKLKTGGGLSCDAEGLSGNFLPSTDFILTQESTTSTAYTNLATVGPTVTITTGVAAWVLFDAEIISSSGGPAKMSVAVSGASTVAATDNYALVNPSTNSFQIGFITLITGLTAGSNTFQAKYKTQTAGTAFFGRRRLIVVQ